MDNQEDKDNDRLKDENPHEEHIDMSALDQDTLEETQPEKNESSVPDTQTTPIIAGSATSNISKFGKFKHWYISKKKLSIPLTIILICLLILAVPLTRYKVLGLFIKKDFVISVLDSKTNKPVTETEISLSGKTTKTDKDGKATLRVPLGKSTLKLNKKYYTEQTNSVFVGFSDSSNAFDAKLEATGRQVPISVVNKISKQPLANVVLDAAGTQIRTDEEGKATIVLPDGSPTVDGTISLDGYNQQNIKVTITEDKTENNTFGITPLGKIYFLSKLSGKIDVVKTNLDGTDRKTVLPATGKEDQGNTILLASRDWKYLALLSKRDGTEKLFLIETETDKLTVIDEGDVTFTLNGWLNDNFVYTVSRNKLNEWQNKRLSLKAFNAPSKKISSLSDSQGKGTDKDSYAELTPSNVYLVGDKVLYTDIWYYAYEFLDDLDKGNKDSIVSINPDGSNKSTLKSIKSLPTQNISAKAYTPDEIYFEIYDYNSNKSSYLEYENGVIKNAIGVNEETFNSFYPTYLASPSGKQTSWYEERDGKNSLFIGDASGSDGKEIAFLTDLIPYGWYTDDYLLYSKNSSELFILPTANTKKTDPLKITDYHRPNYDFSGYGGGYGGF